jgi:hypothetical protein
MARRKSLMDKLTEVSKLLATLKRFLFDLMVFAMFVVLLYRFVRYELGI